MYLKLNAEIIKSCPMFAKVEDSFVAALLLNKIIALLALYFLDCSTPIAAYT